MYKVNSSHFGQVILTDLYCIITRDGR